MGSKISFVEMRKLKLGQSRPKNLNPPSSSTPGRASHLVAPSVEKPTAPPSSSPSKKQKASELDQNSPLPSAVEKDLSSKPTTEKRVHKHKWYVTQNVELHSFWHHEFNPRTMIDTQELIRIAEKERIQMHMQVEKMNAEFGEVEKLKKEPCECTQERNMLCQQQQELKKTHDTLINELQEA